MILETTSCIYEDRAEGQSRETREELLDTLQSVLLAIEARDESTAAHCQRVTAIAVAIGRELQLSPDEIEDLRWGSLLHDVGKIAIDPHIKNKPSKLTHEEYEHVMLHANFGASIVRPIVNDQVAEMVAAEVVATEG